MRHQGLLLATVYGHGVPVSLVLDQHHFGAIARESSSGSQIVTLSIDGKEGGLALVKNVQRDALKKTPLHLDLQRISLQQQLHVTVSVVLEGEPVGLQEGGMLEIAMHSLHLSCAAGAVPDKVTHDISAMHMGDTLEASAFVLPEGSILLDRPEECVALIRQPRTAPVEVEKVAAVVAAE
jgi:large subunit ribosomal protein L25